MIQGGGEYIRMTWENRYAGTSPATNPPIFKGSKNIQHTPTLSNDTPGQTLGNWGKLGENLDRSGMRFNTLDHSNNANHPHANPANTTNLATPGSKERLPSVQLLIMLRGVATPHRSVNPFNACKWVRFAH
jgi:hypothetical protein